MLATTARGFVVRGLRRRAVAVGSSRRSLLRAFPALRPAGRLGAGAGTVRVWRSAHGLAFGVRRGRVSFVSVYDRRRVRGRRGLTGYLGRSR